MAQDREAILENMGLSEKPQVAPPESPKVEPPKPESPKPVVPWTKRTEPVKSEPLKVELKKEEKPPELILGKFKTQDDLIKSYQELEKKLGSRQPESKPEEPPKPEPSFEIKEDEIPDAVLDPEGHKTYLRNLPYKMLETFRMINEGERQTQRMWEKWSSDNPDIADLQAEVKSAVSSDPRLSQLNQQIMQGKVTAKNAKEILDTVVQEKTNHYRAISMRIADAARQEERSKIAGISPSAPQTTPEYQPPAETTGSSENVDAVDEYLQEREALAVKRRGYGFSRDDASRSMNR